MDICLVVVVAHLESANANAAFRTDSVEYKVYNCCRAHHRSESTIRYTLIEFVWWSSAGCFVDGVRQ